MRAQRAFSNGARSAPPVTLSLDIDNLFATFVLPPLVAALVTVLRSSVQIYHALPAL